MASTPELNPTTDWLTVAVRAHTILTPTQPDANVKPRKAQRPRERQTDTCREMLVFDVETLVDHTQALRFGNWQYCRLTTRGWQCVEEGLIYDDALPTSDPEGFAVLRRYTETRRAATEGGKGRIRLLSRDEFVRKVFLPAAYESRARVVGFNLAFDLSRLAIKATTGRGRNHESFAFVLRPGNRAKGYPEYMQVPRLRIKHGNTHRNDIAFIKPKDSKQRHWSGDFVDVHTLVHALTGEGHSLASACEAFGVAGKFDPGDHGRPIDADYIDYCRQDVTATRGLYVEAVKRLDSLGLPVTPPEVKSAATLAKRTLEALGVQPITKRMPNLDLHGFGIAMTAFYGGRAECRIRRVPVPVRLVDFTATYPTLSALLRMWRLVIAERWEQVDCADEIRDLLGSVTVEDCFDPDLWPRLVGFALVKPEDDVLPVRAQYDPNRPAFGIGVNHLTSTEPLWYPLPEVVSAALIAGRPPKILKAFRLHPVGVVDGLTPLTLPGGHVVDPAVDDPWKAMVEQRQRVRADEALDPSVQTGQQKGLKVASNSGAYGIWSEYNSDPQSAGNCVSTTIFGRYDQPWTDNVRAPETPGRYCAPPIAAVVTSGARLLLTLLERCVTDFGGSWAMADTDSMAIVANEHGGLLACPGGSELSTDSDSAIRILTYQQVEEIRQRFVALNPYDRSAVPDNILKHEADAYCYAVAAKRYALFTYDPGGIPRLVPNKVHAVCSHGLGHALNPYGHDKAIPNDRWVRELWEYHLAREVSGLDPEEPEWFDRPVLSQINVTSPAILNAFRSLNVGRHYAEQVKPFNFLTYAPGAQPPAGIGPEQRYRLITAFATDLSRWRRQHWINLHDPKRKQLVSIDPTQPSTATLATYRTLARRYIAHPEVKALGPDGQPCRRETIGVLSRRHARPARIATIGKEANRVDDRAAGLVDFADADRLLLAYPEPQDLTLEEALAIARDRPLSEVAEAIGRSRKRTKDVLIGRSVPRADTRRRLLAYISQVAKHSSEMASTPPNWPLMLS